MMIQSYLNSGSDPDLSGVGLTEREVTLAYKARCLIVAAGVLSQLEELLARREMENDDTAMAE
jgi:hypothetical protein